MNIGLECEDDIGNHNYTHTRTHAHTHTHTHTHTQIYIYIYIYICIYIYIYGENIKIHFVNFVAIKISLLCTLKISLVLCNVCIVMKYYNFYRQHTGSRFV